MRCRLARLDPSSPKRGREPLQSKAREREGVGHCKLRCGTYSINNIGLVSWDSHLYLREGP